MASAAISEAPKSAVMVDYSKSLAHLKVSDKTKVRPSDGVFIIYTELLTPEELASRTVVVFGEFFFHTDRKTMVPSLRIDFSKQLDARISKIKKDLENSSQALQQSIAVTALQILIKGPGLNKQYRIIYDTYKRVHSDLAALAFPDAIPPAPPSQFASFYDDNDPKNQNCPKDVTFIVEKNDDQPGANLPPLRAHKMVLMTHEAFQTLQGNQIELGEGNNRETVTRLIEYLYKKTVPENLTNQEAHQLYRLALELKVRPLMQLCNYKARQEVLRITDPNVPNSPIDHPESVDKELDDVGSVDQALHVYNQKLEKIMRIYDTHLIHHIYA